MRIINLVDTIDRVNFGIYNAAIATAKSLQERHNVRSEIWAPSETAPFPSPSFQPASLFLVMKTDESYVKTVVSEQQLDPSKDIIVSHGTWQWPTIWANAMQKRGFKWVYVPHGMLEPWSMSQKKFKKMIYFNLFEKRFGRNADFVRAVGGPEFENLKHHFSNVVLIPNGTDPIDLDFSVKTDSVRSFLFLARLHFKKGVVPLVEAWADSSLANNPGFQLNIAGPDDGEKKNMEAILALKKVKNIKYLGAIYGADKLELLQKSHFYVLPSLSEGFPTSVVEAMLNGEVPLISLGCNFPEAFGKGLAIETPPDKDGIIKSLEKAAALSGQEWRNLAEGSRKFILENYTTDRIADQQFELYNRLLGRI